MPIISLKTVNFIRSGQKILENINWTVEKNEHWAILGLNGSGKSSLLKLIMAENWKTSGEITVLGTRFGLDPIPELRAKIGIVGSFIAERFRPDIIAENLVLTGRYNSSMLYRAFSEQDLDVARDLMRQIGADKLIGRIYGTLSQGEKQLLLIARSLMIAPEILILDEATNGLDLFAKERLLDKLHMITQLANGPTLLYITHHPDEITSDFQKTLLLRDGKIIDSGATKTILTEKTLTDFYQMPVDVERVNGKYFVIPKKSDT
ncbi:putative ABC transporter ATP-binding protein YmeB [Lactococcus hodotermopsidis]|uniref:Putative ABC transporter ATP-binding protein YmeB n=1 Tax=Pseudolactococcus hodotermopsidis TaxID=2709157 RepID=A0A6A0BDN0_9LACT|nr:ABC transporter ATP-binding protein [Lactococcus hodotermopsidis]GFH42594.1 putative ABC transporter ATP-binding protein YmeB [Lactococcus hodotermopsidis]